MIASAAASTATNLAGSAFSQVLVSLVMGSFNPEYNKESRKRMRYIQQKYSLAYEGGKAGEDPCGIIAKIDPNSKLLMDPSGKKPANPFPDERVWEDSLVTNFHPVSGHQGRFVASHVLTCIGMINDYQNHRRRRPWVPGVITPGRPNDYINLFLEETKTWLRTQLSLDTVAAEELKKREKFYSNLKHDNYYWCFPNENDPMNNNKTIYHVIDYIHDKIKNAYEIISREELNKSLQLLFKECNDHTTNFFEFGKIFLAYLLAYHKKMGENITTSSGYDGNSIENGKLHFLLTRVTSIVFETYQKDLELTNQRLYGSNGIDGGSSMLTNGEMGSSSLTSYMIKIKTYEKSTLPITSTSYLMQIEDPKQTKWIVKKNWNDFETFHDQLMKELIVYTAASSNAVPMIQFPSKDQRPSQYQQLLNSNEYHDAIIALLNGYCDQLASCIFHYQYYPKVQKIIAQFLETKYLINTVAPPSSSSNALVPSAVGGSGGVVTASQTQSQLVYAESIPNIFVAIKQHYQNHLLHGTNSSINNSTSSSSPAQSRFSTTAILDTLLNRKPATTDNKASESKDDPDNTNSITVQNQSGGKQYNIFEEFTGKEWTIFQKIWGPEYGLKILHGYSLLQRIATILGWTLEINHFFISMFGNTLSFSKLPLHDIITTQKELIQQFLTLSNELYSFACQLNEEGNYKFHKNLQMTENELKRLIYHGNHIIRIIQMIEKDHLDYDAQIKRLKDCHERFQPFLYRIGNSLLSIQNELQLNVPNYTFIEKNIPKEMLMIQSSSSSLSPREDGTKIRTEEKMSRGDAQVEVIEEVVHGKGGGERGGGGGGDYKGGDEKETDASRKRRISNPEDNPAFAIFSRSSSETIRPAIEKPNPLNSDEFTAAPKDTEDGSRSQSKREGKLQVEDELERMNVQYVRNEESSAVCIIT